MGTARYRDALPQLGGALFMRGDGYTPASVMSATEAKDYHQLQVDTFADAAADLVTGITFDAATSGYPAYYMINCAHPTHFDAVLRADAPWAARIRGLRANASRMSHAELNETSELDAGDPAELGREYAALRRQRLRHLNVMGGCCGTDHRHVEQIAAACLPLFRKAP